MSDIEMVNFVQLFGSSQSFLLPEHIVNLKTALADFGLPGVAPPRQRTPNDRQVRVRVISQEAIHRRAIILIVHNRPYLMFGR